MVLQLDPFKTKSERNSNQILDVLGDVGGFYQAIDLIIFTFGEFFSAKFFIVSIAANLYLRKLPSDQNGKKDENSKDGGPTNKTFLEDSQIGGNSVDILNLSNGRQSAANLRPPDDVNISKMFQKIKFSPS